ncbi:MAG: B12-binding domain-containing radical SAM protein [Actinobacteria bacterium]|nr:B12-binding domain-containing radical SAM protein [Actinomycetota bacterium]
MNNSSPGRVSPRQKPKIVLLFPEPLEGSGYSLEIPLSILAVAAPLHADGYEVILIDERLRDDPEGDILKAADGAICVGVSTITGFQLQRAIKFSRMIKDRWPDMPIVWGGYHPSLLPEQCAAEPYVDAVVRGQGERSFQEIISRLEAGADFSGVAGVTFRDAAGEVVSNPDRPMDNVDSFPPAPYELLDIDRFFRLNGGRRALQFISSQGCPFKCTFCVEPKVFGKWSGRSAEHVVDEVEALYRKHHLIHVTFSDPNFFVDRKRVEAMCRMFLERGIRITWSAAARADQVVRISPELSRLMSESGCSQIGIGVESGSQTILDMIDKRTSPEKAIRSNQILEQAGIQGCYAFMVGFPKELDESEDEIRQTLRLIQRMRKSHPEVITVTFYVTPYPGTPIYDMAVKLNLKMPEKTEDWADWESTSVQTTWITPAEKDLVERCNSFYFPFAYPNHLLRKRLEQLKWKPLLYPLHWMAAARCRFGWYGLPFEWRLIQRLARMNRFRKFGSQIDALRGY